MWFKCEFFSWWHFSFRLDAQKFHHISNVMCVGVNLNNRPTKCVTYSPFLILMVNLSLVQFDFFLCTERMFFFSSFYFDRLQMIWKHICLYNSIFFFFQSIHQIRHLIRANSIFEMPEWDETTWLISMWDKLIDCARISNTELPELRLLHDRFNQMQCLNWLFGTDCALIIPAKKNVR